MKSVLVKNHFAQTAKQMIKEDGIEGISVRRIAVKAGYSVATLYNHFTNLDALLWQSRSILISDIAEHLNRSIIEDPKDVKEVTSAFKGYMNYFIENPKVYRFLFFYHLDGKFKTSKNFIEEDQTNSHFANTFEYLIKFENYSNEEAVAIVTSIVLMVQGILTLFISDNDDLNLEDINRQLEAGVKLLIKPRERL